MGALSKNATELLHCIFFGKHTKKHLKSSDFHFIMVSEDGKLDLIWNLSLVCPWDCEICCVDAAYVSSEDGEVVIKSGFLTDKITFVKEGRTSLFNQAARTLQEKKAELDLEHKLKVLDNLSGRTVKINFSGGDPLVVDENIEVIREFSRRFGREYTEVSTTGAGLAKSNPEELGAVIGKLKFSYDAASGLYNPNRPRGYNNSNLHRASQYGKEGVFTVAETPLSIRNTNDEAIELIYENLHRADIDTVLLMRLFPVGRGLQRKTEIPTKEQYRSAIQKYRELESRLGTPKLRVQCALKYLDQTDGENPCDLFRESFAITPKGIFITSAWALGRNGEPLDDAFVLGDLTQDHVDTILATPKAQTYRERMNDNFGHCKIFSYFNSQKQDPLERIFDKADPLYRGK